MPIRDAREWLTFFFICLMPFQDTILQATPLQGLGSTFAVVPLLLLVFLDVAKRLMCLNFEFERFQVALAVYAFLLSIFGISVFSKDSSIATLTVEAVKMALDSILVLYVIFGVDYSGRRLVGVATQIAFFLTIAGILANDLNLLGLRALTNNAFFHQTAIENVYEHRWRGLAKEPSVLAPLIMGLGLLCAHFAKNGWTKKTYWFMALTFTALGGSKGGIICLLLILLLIFVLRAKASLVQAFALILVALPVVVIGVNFLIPSFGTEALTASNSIATHLTMQLVAGMILLHYPLGIGFGAMFPAIGRFLEQGMQVTQSLVPIPLNFDELKQFTTDTQIAGAKSLAANFAIFFGFPFLVTATMACFRLARKLYALGEVALLACVLFMIFQFCTSIDSLAFYNLYFPFGIAVYEIRRHANSTSHA